jgi:hypothetical protein
MEQAKRDACCQIAAILENQENDIVDKVVMKRNEEEITLEEAFQDGWANGLGEIFTDWEVAKVTLFVKKVAKGKKPEDWKVKPFDLMAMDLILPDKDEEYGDDDIVAKFQLIGFYLDSNGIPQTMSKVYVNCYLFERYKGRCPELMLEEEYRYHFEG